MTHRPPSKRWQKNPERRVGQAQLNRVAEAEKTGTVRQHPGQQSPATEPQHTAAFRP